MGDQIDPRVAASRSRIADAASRLFATNGYVATTVADIADEASVAVQTVYNAVGTKSAVLNLVLDTAASGTHSPGSVATFLRERVSAAANAHHVVEVLADWLAEVHPRIANVFAVITEAAAVDQEIAELKVLRDRQRFQNYHDAARALIDVGGGGGATQQDLAATIWSLGHPSTFAMLVLDEGWEVERYRDWIGARLHAALEA